MAVKLQTWGDNLRLPTYVNAGDTVSLLMEVEQYRKPAIPFQSKHLPALKRNQWYALKRPARGGLLCVWPAQRCCVYVSGEPPTPKRPTPRVALMRLRVDPQFLVDGAGLTVFAASLSTGTRRLWVEDVLMWKGRHVFTDEPFSKRLCMATQWLEHYCILDPRLLDGLDVEMAQWQSLNAIQPDGTWELMEADECGRRRLYWVATPVLAAPAALPPPAPDPVPVPKMDGPLIAVATKEGGPDQWALASADGVTLGRALVRKLEISSALRGKATVRVEVTWSTNFNKWEIVKITDGIHTAHSSAFQRP